jgi:competence ComEA-like helix-hairpin-helix protein
MISNMKRLVRALLPLALLPIAQSQELPDGSGKELTNRVCGACHEAGVVVKYHNSKDDWESVVEDMRGRGADGSDEDFKAIGAYLARYFGPDVNVNRAAAADLESELGITAAEAAAIVKYRQAQGNFKDFSDLGKVPGLDVKKLEPLKQRIVF